MTLYEAREFQLADLRRNALREFQINNQLQNNLFKAKNNM
jgi:hypothetical protein